MKNCYIYIYLDPRKRGHFCYENVCFLYEPIYVGKGQRKRYLNHLKNLDKHINGHFKNKLLKILKSEFTNFDIENHIVILRDKVSEQEAFDLEKQLITGIGRLNSEQGPLTNLADGGKGGISGKSRSEETKKKISQARLGIVFSEETRKKMSLAKLGTKHSEETKKKMCCRRHSEETRKKMVSSRVGKKHSEETKEKLRKPKSEETRKKMSLAQTGKRLSEEAKRLRKPKSEETKKKISQARLGIVFSEEARKKMSLAKLGTKHSEETKKKISLAQVGRSKKRREVELNDSR